MHTPIATCVGTFKGNWCRNKPRETGSTRDVRRLCAARLRTASSKSENYLEFYFKLKAGKDRVIQMLQILCTEKMSKFIELRRKMKFTIIKSTYILNKTFSICSIITVLKFVSTCSNIIFLSKLHKFPLLKFWLIKKILNL